MQYQQASCLRYCQEYTSLSRLEALGYGIVAGRYDKLFRKCLEIYFYKT
ncbi:MAG: hypothetical protein IPK35_18115 [Saprospiraceae bacterium]|nr:hypothetical protein [Saprospiraceae bacterium]